MNRRKKIVDLTGPDFEKVDSRSPHSFFGPADES